MTNGRPRDGRRVVEAEFAGISEAQQAVRALELAGVEGGLISLEGPGANRAEKKPDTRAADRRLASRLGTRVLVSAALGAGAGAAAGFLISWAIGLGLAGTWGLIVAAAVGAGAIGGLLGGYSGVPMGETSEVTEQPVRGRTIVRVQVENADDVRRTEEILRQSALG